MGLNFITYSEDIHDLFMANQPREMLTFPRVEGHEMPCLPHDIYGNEILMGVSAQFHRINILSLVCSRRQKKIGFLIIQTVC